jgi:hypothetical protein
MKKISAFLLVLISFSLISGIEAKAQTQNLVNNLNTLNPELVKLFPRWVICDQDLAFRVYQAFLHLQKPKSNLNEQKIEVLAAPRKEGLPFEILLITSGEESIGSVQIDDVMPELADFINGVKPFDPNFKGKDIRKYCFVDVSPEQPVSPTQANTIVNYFQPTNVTQSISISLFEQSLKIGETGFWIVSEVGNDPIGYPFWTGGESKVKVRIPLGNENLDYNTKRDIPFDIYANLGYGYRISSGLKDKSSFLSWVSERRLNSGYGGKLIGGFDFLLPFHRNAGIHFNIELPTKKVETSSIDPEDTQFWKELRSDIVWDDPNKAKTYKGVVPMLRGVGQLTVFYNYWLKENGLPYHYFRFEAGIGYSEVREFASWRDESVAVTYITVDSVSGLKTYKPNEFMDWVILKAEYRNQALHPFGFSLQYSNQTLLATGFVKIFGDWLFLEGKYSTPLRTARPYEISNFFLLSPVLRITLNETKKQEIKEEEPY